MKISTQPFEESTALPKSTKQVPSLTLTNSTATSRPASSSTTSSTPSKNITSNHLGFGVEISRLDVDFSKIKSMGAKWVRYNGVVWSDIEEVENQYQWDKLSALEDAIKRSNQAGLNMILIVRSTPAWAQNIPGSFCGPVSPQKLPAFAKFMSALAARFSASPMQINYWELWNEPDIDPSLVAGNSVFGCWGNSKDEFYGGAYYTEMLKIVSPAIRAANRNAKIFLGGLLLDCDPTNPGTPGRCMKGYELPPKFFEGVIKSGGAAYLDYVSYHGYPSFDPKAGSPVPAELNMYSWQARGGVVLGKANFLREVMKKYNVNLPLFLTETSLLCPEKLAECSPASQTFFQRQAEYGAWLLVRNSVEDIGTIWFTFDGPGWRSGGILDDNQNLKPVYSSMQFISSLLGDSKFISKLEAPDLIGFEFTSSQGTFYFLNSFADQPKVIISKDNQVKTLDIFGKPIPDQ